MLIAGGGVKKAGFFEAPIATAEIYSGCSPFRRRRRAPPPPPRGGPPPLESTNLGPRDLFAPLLDTLIETNGANDSRAAGLRAVFIGGRMAEVLYFGKGTAKPGLEPGACPIAAWNCSGPRRPRAPDVYGPAEQRSYDQRAKVIQNFFFFPPPPPGPPPPPPP